MRLMPLVASVIVLAPCWIFVGACGSDSSPAAAPPPAPDAIAPDGEGTTTKACATGVSAGGQAACAVDGNGGLWCWGSRIFGQIGDGSLGGNATVPTQVKGLESGVVEVATGNFHTCARKSDGTVWCWGMSDVGQLGDGATTGDACDPDATYRKSVCRASAVRVSGLAGVAEIASGAEFSCARKDDGTVWCWGANNLGQLGTGTAIGDACSTSTGSVACRSTPVQASGVGGAVELAAGAGHMCARLGNGTIMCWGYNRNGQLLNGTSGGSVPTPTAVTAAGAGIASVAAGQHHTCISRSDGTVACWGLNEQGQVGTGSFSTSVTTLQNVALDGKATRIRAGQVQSCAVLESGALRCWGEVGTGEKQDGSGYKHASPIPVPGLTDGVVDVRGGYFHTCALLKDTTVRCFGWNTAGEIGNGTTTSDTAPPTPPTALSWTCPR